MMYRVLAYYISIFIFTTMNTTCLDVLKEIGLDVL